MKRAIRTQSDELGDLYSEAARLDFTDAGDKARQEFRDETDINLLLRRHGVGLPLRPPTFGTETDFTIDLQTALNAIDQAKKAYAKLPENLRKHYRTWQALLTAIDRGQLEISNEEIVTPPEPPIAPVEG